MTAPAWICPLCGSTSHTTMTFGDGTGYVTQMMPPASQPQVWYSGSSGTSAGPSPMVPFPTMQYPQPPQYTLNLGQKWMFQCNGCSIVFANPSLFNADNCDPKKVLDTLAKRELAA